MPNLVGIGNSQVPTNAMLGGLAYQDSVGEINIEKIKARTSDTVVDIFVYDTSKDSDGGAWRKKATKQSWYNENVSQRRGARKEFPAVAVIVCLSNHIKIYDGDDSNLSLWMDVRATSARRDHGWMYGSTLNAVTALNGIIAIAANDNSGDEGGVLIMDFVKDELRRHDDGTSRSGGGLYISQRGTSANLNVAQNVPVIVDSYVTAITMTLLPNALIDESTGLPIPTIIAGTRRGISVIRDSGVVYDMLVSANSGLNYETNSIKITKDLKIIHNWDDRVSDGYSFISIIPLSLFQSDSSYGYEYQFRNEGVYSYNVGSGSLDIFNSTSTFFVDAVPTELGYFAIGSNKGLVNIQHKPQALNNGGRSSLGDARFSGGMHCRITNNFNTGWMHGNIKGAFLSSTDDNNITGTELVSNPGPYSSTTGWIADNGFSVSNSNNRLVIDSDNNTGSYFGGVHTLNLVSGTQYVLVVNIHSQTKTAVIRLTGSGTYFTSTGLGTGEHAFYFTADQVSHSIRIGSDTGGDNRTQELSSVSIKEVEEDRSINQKGLQVFGTVTKSAVATGAELVSYGPFSTSNRLQQPYNSDLNFEANDFSVMFWMNNNGTDIHQTLVGRDNREFSVDILNNSSYNRRFRIYAYNSSNSLQTFDSNDDPFPLNTWSHVCVNYTGGNTCSVYVNGVLNKSGTLNYDIDDTSHGLNIGARNTSGSYAHAADGTKLALLRISKSAPTDEQIKKIYEDERCLFHENAKCTLHGTSDYVKALSFDDTNDVLHVGTSAGRSEFQGLNRINNTTTAVTTAISVSNEFVAEQ